MLMRCTPIIAGLVLSSIVFATAPAQAQVSIDVSKITCDQYVHDKIPTSAHGILLPCGAARKRALVLPRNSVAGDVQIQAAFDFHADRGSSTTLSR